MKEYLSQKGVKFEEKDVSRDYAAAQELAGKTGQNAVPVIDVNGRIIVGFDRPKLDQALAAGQRKPLGAAVSDAAKVPANFSGGATTGAYIVRVRTGSVAEKMGLKVGDVITNINGYNISGMDDVQQNLSRVAPGSLVQINFSRGGKIYTAEGEL